MNVSVIVLSWNGIEYLANCLDALLAQTRPADQIIVVDNGSQDGSADFVAQNYPSVQLIRNERNLGFSVGMNMGIQAASGDILILLNQDTVARPDWLEKLVSAMSADSAIGIAGCKLLYPDSTIQHGGAIIVNARGDSSHLGWHEPDRGQCDAPFDAEAVTGAALAITREALDRIGPLDEGFSPAYYEDMDWCYRVRQAGYRVRYVPEAVVVHHESPHLAHLTSEESLQAACAFQRNRVRFVLKHWSAARMMDEFAPQEKAWLNELVPGSESSVAMMRRVYLANLLALGELAEWRRRLVLADAVDEMASTLVQLRQACILAEAKDAMGANGEAFGELRASGVLAERPFRSNVPVVGRAIAGMRATFNDISTRWYVLPLMQQQTDFNARAVAWLERLEARYKRLEVRYNRDLAELTQELSTLAEQLQNLERRSLSDGK